MHDVKWHIFFSRLVGCTSTGHAHTNVIHVYVDKTIGREISTQRYTKALIMKTNKHNLITLNEEKSSINIIIHHPDGTHELNIFGWAHPFYHFIGRVSSMCTVGRSNSSGSSFHEIIRFLLIMIRHNVDAW